MTWRRVDMADDFSNLRIFKESFLQASDDIVNIKKKIIQKPKTRVCFIITKNKSHSWIDDFHAQAQLDTMERVYH
jgi:hypothetical protein